MAHTHRHACSLAHTQWYTRTVVHTHTHAHTHTHTHAHTHTIKPIRYPYIHGLSFTLYSKGAYNMHITCKAQVNVLFSMARQSVFFSFYWLVRIFAFHSSYTFFFPPSYFCYTCMNILPGCFFSNFSGFFLVLGSLSCIHLILLYFFFLNCLSSSSPLLSFYL